MQPCGAEETSFKNIFKGLTKPKLWTIKRTQWKCYFPCMHYKNITGCQKLTLGIGIPTTLQVNVTGIPSTALRCFSFLSKMGMMHFPVGISSCWTSSSDSSTGVLSRRNSISLISLCSKLVTLYSYKTHNYLKSFMNYYYYCFHIN